jgi:predicted dehydrogenase
MKKFRVGVAGVGFIGAAHVEVVRRLGNVEVVALAEALNAQKKADALFVPKGYADYREMIDNEKLDAIHVCTPNNAHYDMVKYALKKGLHVLCEKPLTCTAAEAEELYRLSAEKGVIAAVNFFYRFFPMVYQMREMIRSGEVGNIYTVHGGYLQDWLFLDTDYSWRLEPEASGASRAFADIGSHWIDCVEHITGLKVVELLADFETFHKTRKKPTKQIDTYSGMALRPEDYEEVPIGTEDYASVLFHFENGAHGSCIISQMAAGRKNQMVVAVAGSKCSLQWDSEDSNDLWIGHRGSANSVLTKDPSILSPGAASITGYPGGHVEGMLDTFRHLFKKFYASIGSGRFDEDLASFKDGVREMELCEKVIQSAAERRWITLG